MWRYRPGANQHHQLHLLAVVVPLGAAARYYEKEDVSEAGKVLISTAWTRTRLVQTETVEMHPSMCGATGLVLVSTVNLIFLSFFFAVSSSWSSTRSGVLVACSTAQAAAGAQRDECLGSRAMFVH